MKATTRIEVNVEIGKEDAAPLFNLAREPKCSTDQDYQAAGEQFRLELEKMVNRAVRVGLGAYESAKM